MGHLFNKESVLQGLLEKSLPECFAHIRGMKDIKSLKFTTNPASLISPDEDISSFICPVTKMEFNGLQPFVAIWSTGYVLSEKAIKEVNIDGLQDEYGPFVQSDIVKLIPLESELEQQLQAMQERKALRKQQQKAAKLATTHLNEEDDGNVEVGGETRKKKSSSGKKRKHEQELAEESVMARTTQKKISSAGVLVQSVTASVKEHEERSAVYKSLFHQDHEKDRTDKDLFMTVAGLRYTLG